MTDHQQGSSAYFQAQFLDQPGGAPTTPTAISLSFLDADSTVAGPFTTGFTQVATGLYSYVWTIPADLPLGEYTAAWTATVDGSTSSGFETFNVIEGSDVIPGFIGWATAADVLELTNTTVTTADLSQAQGIVDLYAGVTYAAVADLSVRDLRLLRAATAYQAAWMLAQIDVTSRTSVSSINQDGAVVVPTDADSLVLAPLARRALSALTWLKRTGTVDVRRPRRPFAVWEQYRDAWLNDTAPDCHPGNWRSM